MGNERIEVGFNSYVAGKRGRFAACRLDLGDDGLAGLDFARGDYNARAHLRAFERDGASDSLGRAGNNRDAAREIE